MHNVDSMMKNVLPLRLSSSYPYSQHLDRLKSSDRLDIGDIQIEIRGAVTNALNVSLASSRIDRRCSHDMAGFLVPFLCYAWKNAIHLLTSCAMKLCNINVEM